MRQKKSKPILLFFILTLVINKYSYSQTGSIDINNTILRDAEYNLNNANIKTERLSVSVSENQEFPEKIYSLSNLVALRVNRRMNSRAPSIKSLSPKINELTKLEHLILEGLEIQSFPNDLRGLKSLKTFQFSNLDAPLLNLPDFNSFPNLEYCYFSLKNKTDLGKIENFKSIFKLTALKRLFLQSCNLNENDFQRIENLNSLVTLNLYENKIADISFITKNESLQILNLRYNNIITIPQDFYNLINLVYLDLSNNNIASLSSDIGKFTKLKVLILDDNNITHLPKEIGNLQNLKDLSLRGNGISDLPKGLFKINSLKRLDLMNTNIKNIPDEIINSKIERLEISSKTECYFEFDAETLAKMKSLKVLVLSSRKVEKKILKEKKKFKKLRPDVTVF